MSQGDLDQDHLQAIRILAQAVEQVRVPGLLEFRLLSGALARTLESRSQQELREASRVFQSLDREFRERIVARAQKEAQAARRGPGEAVPAPRGGSGSGSGSGGGGVPRKAASGFLAALNGARAA